ncbi:MAG: S8 family peptidase [Rhodospirillaceae bacterium]|nr:S8 family peptidase [Rhodospirillaceae bacterium]
MPNGIDERRRHFILEGVTETEAYRSQGRGSRSPIPARNRAQHAGDLKRQIEELRNEAAAAGDAQREAGLEDGLGLQVEFKSFPDIELAFESLAREHQGIELLNVRQEENRTHATVFVPDGKLTHFEGLIGDYLSEKRDSIDRPRDNQRLIDAIRQIRAAGLHALWTDDAEEFPDEDEGPLWWEVWLPIRKQREAVLASFRRLAAAQGMVVAQGELKFPERSVLLVRASVAEMQNSILTLNSIAELRRPKETADFFDSLAPEEQREWLEDLLARTRFTPDGNSAPHVCLLDTGVNRGHPLLAPALAVTDLHTVEPAWGTDDAHGHGTEMAGLALAGNLTEQLGSRSPIEVSHRLESVKLLPHDGAGGNDSRHHGLLTIEAVSRPEITAPARPRVFGMAVTARDNRDRGQPSAWSAVLDSLAADMDGYGAQPRLLIVSAGNVIDPYAWSQYPASNETDGVHDPAQAWNALTVGAFTELVRITEPDAGAYTPIAPDGGLSPFSTTSVSWQRYWPFKPDVVCEGGNAAEDALGPVPMPSLSLLTTHHLPVDRPLTTTNATSAATALASRLAAQVMAEYPGLWPEAVRALIVHSAEWTGAMERMFLPAGGNPSRADYQALVRRCGFGVPDLRRALWSVSNSLTMVVQERLHPFRREPGGRVTTRDMHVHALPWPVDILEDMGETQVEMRVTLSYFVEPNPSQRGVASRYRYASHGLRFDVKRPLESIDAFRGRINAAARDEEEGRARSHGDTAWLIGAQNRHRGSLHGDVWRGSAADLASRGHIAVYPAMGWWRTRPNLERYDQTARYSLVVSIRAPETDVDLYTAVADRIDTPVTVGS